MKIVDWCNIRNKNVPFQPRDKKPRMLNSTLKEKPHLEMTKTTFASYFMKTDKQIIECIYLMKYYMSLIHHRLYLMKREQMKWGFRLVCERVWVHSWTIDGNKQYTCKQTSIESLFYYVSFRFMFYIANTKKTPFYLHFDSNKQKDEFVKYTFVTAITLWLSKNFTIHNNIWVSRKRSEWKKQKNCYWWAFQAVARFWKTRYLSTVFLQ